MDANTRKIEKLFDQTVTYQVPIFQRPYVWNREKNWEPLWEDIQALLDRKLHGAPTHPHFLGAVVLEQLPNSAGSIETRQVIDGQQRFTTLQLFLIAARDYASTYGNTKYIERFSDLVTNKRSKIDHDDEVFKVWPTNSDRPAFRLVHQAGSPDLVTKATTTSSGVTNSHSIVQAYFYFHHQLAAWLSGERDEQGDTDFWVGKTTDDRLECLWQVIKEHLLLVVIDLDKQDETQVIFETLNARGTDLLPADLIKNFLFRRALASGENVEYLNGKYWQTIETEFWREEIKQGRLNRPRIDLFISHYLTMMTQDEVRSAHLFSAFKAFIIGGEAASGSSIHYPNGSASHIEALARYAQVFRKFYEPCGHQRLALFLKRLAAIDTATVYPFLLHACTDLLPGNETEFDKVIALLESFLMRRLICNLTPKNYNRLFLDLLKAVDKEGRVSVTSVEAQLGKGRGESTRFPDNQEVMTAVCEQPMYGRLAQFKVRVILEALDLHAHTSKTEDIPLQPGLTIEHVMPQTWATVWPLDPEDTIDPVVEQKATSRRNVMLNTLGNLTLITNSLNPALSNSNWSTKRPELLKFTKLNLNQYFHGPEADTWNEGAIRSRSEHLFQHLLEIWPDVKRDEISK